MVKLVSMGSNLDIVIIEENTIKGVFVIVLFELKQVYHTFMVSSLFLVAS